MIRAHWTAAAAVGATLLTTAFGARTAHAQFGMYNLPTSDFTWNWGRAAEEGAHRGREDISISGFEAGFACDLTAALKLAGNFSQTDILALENQLRTSIQFIYDTSALMNELELSFKLDWAQLACKKHAAAEPTAEQKAERESKARDKMQREVERRRARAQKQTD